MSEPSSLPTSFFMLTLARACLTPHTVSRLSEFGQTRRGNTQPHPSCPRPGQQRRRRGGEAARGLSSGISWLRAPKQPTGLRLPRAQGSGKSDSQHGKSRAWIWIAWTGWAASRACEGKVATAGMHAQRKTTRRSQSCSRS